MVHCQGEKLNMLILVIERRFPSNVLGTREIFNRYGRKVSRVMLCWRDGRPSLRNFYGQFGNKFFNTDHWILHTLQIENRGFSPRCFRVFFVSLLLSVDREVDPGGISFSPFPKLEVRWPHYMDSVTSSAPLHLFSEDWQQSLGSPTLRAW